MGFDLLTYLPDQRRLEGYYETNSLGLDRVLRNGSCTRSDPHLNRYV